MNHTHVQNSNPAANSGVLRPPLLYGVAILIGYSLDLALPCPIPLGIASKYIAALLFVGGIALLYLTRNAFRQVGTPISGNQPSTGLIESGPFRFSRNPIYVAFLIISLSILIWLHSFWMLFTLPFAILIIAFVVVPREERFMTRKFGNAYEEYKSRTRRWI